MSENPRDTKPLDNESTLIDPNLIDLENAKAKTRKAKKNSAQTVKLRKKRFYASFEEETSTGKKFKHHYTCTYSDPYSIKKQVQSNNYASFQKFKLNLEALQIKNTGKIDHLIALDAIRTKLTPYNFQMNTALQVINEMNANAILADEVGLGKTIEAGLIMKELLLRGEINSILIISPKSLLSQWKSEMSEKFGETFAIANYPGEHVDLKADDRIICSHSLDAPKV